MKVSVKSGIAVAVITGMMGLSGVILTPTLGQVISQVSSQDKEALAEADRLTQQVVELHKQGKYNEAIPLAEKVLAIRRRLLGNNNPATVSTINNLAFFYESQGRYPEAEPLYKEVLTFFKEKLGDTDIGTAFIQNNLAYYLPHFWTRLTAN